MRQKAPHHASPGGAALGRGSPLVVVRSLREDETLGWDVWCVGLGPGSGSF